MDILTAFLTAYAVAGRHAKIRLSHLASAGRRSGISVPVGLMSAIVVMPKRGRRGLPCLRLNEPTAPPTAAG